MAKIWVFAIGIMILVAAGFYFLGQGSASPTGNVISDGGNGPAQKVNLGLQNFNYYPRELRVKAGVPVELTLDGSVSGCLRSFTIPAIGFRGYSKSPSEKLKFTIPQKGTYNFACSMGMGYGKIIAE